MMRILHSRIVLVAVVTVVCYFCIVQSAIAGSLVGWGNNESGKATPPPGNDFVAIAAEQMHSLALKSDGSLVGWGYDYWGQATPPDGNDYVAITAGYESGLALKSDGSIVGWGRNECGKATPPPGNDFVAIAAGDVHGLALKSDGSIVGWGVCSGDPYDFGQDDAPVGNDFVAIADGRVHCLAIAEPERGELTLVDPNGGETFIVGRICTINWLSTGNINQILIEYSTNDGGSWAPVTPANAGNNRRYNWLLPQVTSNQCIVRITDANDPAVSDISDAPFTIYECTLTFDLSGDCFVNFFDVALLVSEWLQCSNPFDPNCVQ